jgi:F0F1-type ATP synthase beta subunit
MHGERIVQLQFSRGESIKPDPVLLNLGTVAAVRGSVVDIRFDGHLPPIYSLLHAQEGEIVIEVLAQLDARHVRGIALTPTQGLARGMAVEDTGGPLKALVGTVHKFEKLNSAGVNENSQWNR